MTSSSLPFAWGGSPLGVDVEWVHFKPREMNEKMYAVLSTDSRAQLVSVLGDNLLLYRLPDAFFVLDVSKRSILYLMQFAEEVILEKRVASKLRLWRNAGEIRSQDLGEQIFYEHLLPRTDCVVSDPQVTSYGHSFWELRIIKAFQLGYAVYLLDPKKSTPQLLKSPEEGQDLLDVLSPLNWSGRRIAVCRSRIWG
jgi:hypothetical protein